MSRASTADGSYMEPLTPLDLLMPKLYIRVLLAFQTTEPFVAVLQRLQSGLDLTAEKIPWISGRVSLSNNGGPELDGIRYSLGENFPSIVNSGSISAPLTSLEAHKLETFTIPEHVWPLKALPGLDLLETPVFGASLFHFNDDNGLGLCICMHHSAVDATGFTEVLRIWAGELAASGSSQTLSTDTRLARISDALASDLDDAASQTVEQLFESLPQFSPIPPSMPSKFPAFASKMFTIPTERLNTLKDLVGHHLGASPTTNTMLCALLWSSITRIRAQDRKPPYTSISSCLITAVNGRRRISPRFSTPDDPYLGNVVLYAPTQLAFTDLELATESHEHLAKVCDAIAQSYAATSITSQHIANAMTLGKKIGDYSKIFVGWDLFNHKDLTITSWADQDLYQMDWGSALGRPEFVRFPPSQADGVCVMLPRKRGGLSPGSKEIIEFEVMLKEEHLEALKRNNGWQNLMGPLDDASSAGTQN